MSSFALLHLDGHWLAFDGDEVRRLDARPKLDRAAIAITDFDGAISQVTALEGSPAHAVALIEKRLRADGLIDNESKILIHQTKVVGNGYQALFTAIPLDRWQQLFAWAEGHDDHCLLVPSVALLWRMLRPGRGVILHSGRHVTFLASLRNRIVHATALAFSEDAGDLSMTVAAMAERAGRDLAGEDEALQTLEIEWYGSLTPEPQASAGIQQHRDDDEPTLRTSVAAAPVISQEDGIHFDGQYDPPADPLPVVPVRPATVNPGRWLDETLAEIFSAQSGAQVKLGPHTLVRDAEGRRYRSGVAKLVANAGAMSAINPPASRMMYLAERVLPWASAASLVLALALAGLGGRWTLAAHDARSRAEAIDSQIAEVESAIARLKARQTIPDAYPQLAEFVGRAGTLRQALDPNAALRDLRMAAGEDVRILRLRLEPDGTGSSLRVDGMVNHTLRADEQGMQVARFVQRLREAGYNPAAVDPQLGNAGSQSPGGSFSYRLRRNDAPAAATPEQAS